MKRRAAAGFGKLLISLLLLPLLAIGESPFQMEHVLTVASDDPVLTAAFCAEGRLAYATEKRVEYGERWQRRAEVYVLPLVGKKKKKRIVRHNFLRDPRKRFRQLSFSVERLNCSPDASRLAVEIRPQERATAAFFFKSTGGALKLRDGGNVVVGYGATWLADNNSVGMLYEAVAPRLLHGIFLVRVEAGRVLRLFRPRTFAAVAWVPGKMQAVLVERDKDFAEPPRLLVGDLTSGKLSDLGPAPDYLGGLGATPDGERFSYFTGQKKLVVRKLTGEAVGEVAIPFTPRYEWVGRSGGLVFLEPEKAGLRSGWLAAWDAKTQASVRLLPDEPIQDFWVDPGGSYVAVLTADKVPELKVYRLVRRD